MLEFLLSSGLKPRGDETYYLGEKHKNRTTRVTKSLFLTEKESSLISNWKMIARVVWSPK